MLSCQYCISVNIFNFKPLIDKGNEACFSDQRLLFLRVARLELWELILLFDISSISTAVLMVCKE